MKHDWLFECMEEQGFVLNNCRFFRSKKEVIHTRIGLYFFEHEVKGIVYIGITHDMKDRISKHKKYEGETIIFFPAGNIKEARLKEIEHAFILIIRPEKNSRVYLNTRSKA